MKLFKVKFTKTIKISPRYSLYLEINSRFLITIIAITVWAIVYMLGG